MTRTLVLSGLKIYTEDGVINEGAVEIAEGQIQAIHARPLTSIENPFTFSSDYALIPGLIDLHVHGAGGVDVMDGTREALSTLSTTLVKEGVTGYLATTMTAPPQKIETVLSVIRDWMNNPEAEGAKILGVHLEGPFLSPDKVGAQNRDHLLPLKTEYLEAWQKLAGPIIKIVTLAPELANSEIFIRFLKQHHIIASIGHSDATYAECCKAIEAGCTQVTHLFNAMRGMHQREPGVVGAALLSHQITAEIIADGVHVHPAMLKLAYQLKTQNKLVLVTDAMRAKCLSSGTYELGGQSVEVKNNIARLKDGTLAGSTLKMCTALKNSMHYTGCDLIQAIQMASENPAKILNIFHQTGSITVGKAADLVVLDSQLNVMLTLVNGQVAYTVPNEMYST